MKFIDLMTPYNIRCYIVVVGMNIPSIYFNMIRTQIFRLKQNTKLKGRKRKAHIDGWLCDKREHSLGRVHPNNNLCMLRHEV